MYILGLITGFHHHFGYHPNLIILAVGIFYNRRFYMKHKFCAFYLNTFSPAGFIDNFHRPPARTIALRGFIIFFAYYLIVNGNGRIKSVFKMARLLFSWVGIQIKYEESLIKLSTYPAFG